MKNKLIQAVFDLDEDLVIDIIKQRAAEGADPIETIDLVQKGIIKVGKEYDKGNYFIADLIMSGLIFNEVMKYIPFQDMEDDAVNTEVRVIMATVEKDIHDIGKNISYNYFRSRGVSPKDLGIDVSPERIVDSIKPGEPTVLFLSGLITASYDSMKKTVALVHEKGLQDTVKIVICGLVDEAVRQYTGADFWVKDVVDSYKKYQELCLWFREGRSAE